MQDRQEASRAASPASTPTMPPAFVQDLGGALRGDVIAPSHAEYEDARQVYNAMIQRRPGAIARVADVADVIACVDAVRDAGVRLAVRGGGHSASGMGTVDGGVVVDLGRLKEVRVDPRTRTVRVGGGCVWGDVDHATHAFGLAVPGGLIASTGVGGLTLGGGTGHLTRSCGLTIDNLLEADVVLADGSFVTANAEEHPDLFWGLRGGGGNFGIVTSFLFRAHPVKNVIAGPTFWDLERGEDVLRAFQHLIAHAPEELNGFFAFMTVPASDPFPEDLRGRKVAAVVWCHRGSQASFDRLTRPLLAELAPLLHVPHEMPFPVLQSLNDPLNPPGLQQYWRGDYFPELGDDAVRLHVTHGATLPTPASIVHLYPLNGAAARVARDGTAYHHRDAAWSQIIAGVDPDPVNAGLLRDWVVGYHDALHPHSTGAGYVNFLMEEEGTQRVQATYGPNYQRLREVKRRYDPDNLFRVNLNIPPAPG